MPAPKRPPQPKLVNFDKKDKEGMLIDLTSPQQQEMALPSMSNGSLDGAFATKINGMSILDAPIDVPTQEYQIDDLNAIDFSSATETATKLEPPPYQSPPTYMNTYGLSSQTSNYSAGPSMEHSQYRNLDPFDTSHIVTTQSQNATTHTYPEVAKLDGTFIRNHTHSRDNIQGSPIAIARPKSAAALQLDEMVQNKISSLSPKSLSKYASTKSYTDTEMELNASLDNLTKSTANDTLNDSLKVNLSSLTLNDTGDSDAPSSMMSSTMMPSTSNENPKLDRAFLAELEKEIYKNDISVANVNVNKTQSNEFSHTNAKDNTVRAISNYAQSPSLNWLQNEIISNVGTPSSSPYVSAVQSPAKSIKMTNYDNAIATPLTLTKKLYNTEISTTDYSTSTTINQSTTTTTTNQSIYSNYSMTNALINNIGTQQITHNDASNQHNYVAQSNQPPNTSNSITNVYNSINSDIYGGSLAGTTAGNVYDIVATNNSDAYYQMIQSNESQPVIYDEVAGDDLRPHRPAPLAPPLILSAQQIQRRLERAQKEQQPMYGNLNGSNYGNNGFPMANHSPYEEISNPNSQQQIYSFIKEISNDGDATEQEAKDALNASNWDHNQAVRHFKIERLLRYGIFRFFFVFYIQIFLFLF